MSERLTLQDLTDLLAEKQGVTKKGAESFLRELISVVSESIEQNETVKIKDFGTFKLVKVNSRKSVDVNTGEANEIPAHYKLSFTPEKSLRDALNVPFSHFESVVIEDGVDFETAKAQIEEQQPALNDTDDVDDNDLTEDTEPEEPIVKVEVEKQSKAKIIDSQVEAEPQSESEPIEVEVEKIEDSADLQVVEPEPGEMLAEAEPESEIEEEAPPVPFTNKEDNADADSEVQDTDEDEETQWEDNSKTKWIIIGLLFLAIIGVCLYIYRDDFFGDDKKDKIETIAEPVEDKTKTAFDSLAATQAVDTISSGKTVQAETANSSKEYTPKEVVTVKKGETLRRLALKHYGSKTFWVYIYQDNKSKIANYNYLQAGQTIAIPAAEKYGINVSDSKSLAKAKTIEEKYFGNK